MYRQNILKKYSIDRPGRSKTINKSSKQSSCFNSSINSTRTTCIAKSFIYSSTSESDDESNSESYAEYFDSDKNENCNKLNERYHINDVEKNFPSDNFQRNLALWAIEGNISLTNLSKLLRILIQDGNHKDLPQDARTLLKTPRNIEVKPLDNGEYVYFGINYFLEEFIRQLNPDYETIPISISADGTPISTSGSNSLWVIFGRLHHKLHSFVLEIALFYGISKPKNFNNFMSDCVAELLQLIQNGYKNKFKDKTYKIEIKCVVADAPALAAIKNVKCHGGYSACTKCEIRGNFSSFSNSVVYSDVHAPLRSDESFRQRISYSQDDEHFVHEAHTILEKLPIDMVKDFPLDKMHLVDEGVIKKILILLTSKVNRQKLPPKKVEIINQRLEKCRKFIPQDFQRKTRSLKYVLKMKSTEYRNFLLYTGPATLKNIIPKATYNHFLTLSLAIRILSSPAHYVKYNNYAKSLLEAVVKLFPKLYGNHNVTFNVHGLLHLADDAKRHGPLESYSCYAFEAHIKQLKKMLHCQNKPLQQCYNRLHEKTRVKLLNMKESENQTTKIEFFESNSGENKYYKAKISSFIIRANSHGDNCVMLQDKLIIRVKYFSFDNTRNTKYVFGQKLINTKPLNNEKCMLLFDMVTGVFESQVTIHSAEKIVCKMCCLPFNLDDANYFVCPIIHTNY